MLGRGNQALCAVAIASTVVSTAVDASAVSQPCMTHWPYACANSSTVSTYNNDNTLQCNVSSWQRANQPIADGGNDAVAFNNANLPLQGMWGGGQGISIFDDASTYFYFADNPTDPGNLYAWSGGADTVTFFPGMLDDAGTKLCSALTVVGEPLPYNMAPGLEAGLGVASPDWRVPPSWEAGAATIGDFIYQVTVNKPDAPYFPPPDGASPARKNIPGANELPSGVFTYGGQTYSFEVGSQCEPAYCTTDNTTHLPVGNVSYMTFPPHNYTSNYPTKADITSAVDFNTSYPDRDCGAPDVYVPANCAPDGGTSQYNPAGWPEAGYPFAAPHDDLPPLGGKFVTVTPVVAYDGYVYLFGTGVKRQSWIYLARFPASDLDTPDGSLVTPPIYLKDWHGFQVWTTHSCEASSPCWSGSPPAPNAFIDAAPMFTTDDGLGDAGTSSPDVGQPSVQYYGDLGIWMMMYAPTGSKKVVYRTAVDPISAGTSWSSAWSDPAPVIDTEVGSTDHTKYCCGLSGGMISCSLKQVLDCSKTDFFGPFLLPYLTNESFANSACTNFSETTTANFTVNYLISSFQPQPVEALYMSFTMQLVTQNYCAP